MNKDNRKFLVINIISVFISISGIVSLIIDEVIKPFLDNYPEVKLIIILVSVLSAYHSLLTFSVRDIVREEVNCTNKQLEDLKYSIELMKDSVPYSTLDDIEYRHGHNNKSVNCEMWVIANMLQEAKNDDSMLLTIYENITKNRVRYYYILPNTVKSHMEIAGLQSRLREIHKRKKYKLTGEIAYRYDDSLSNLITSDYFDIVLFVDCDDKGNPFIIGNSATCEGFQCFSKVSNENNYYYQTIDADKILQIRAFHQSTEFSVLNVGE